MRECKPSFWQFPIAIEWENINSSERYHNRYKRFLEFVGSNDLVLNQDYVRHRGCPKNSPGEVCDVIAFKSKSVALQYKIFMHGMY